VAQKFQQVGKTDTYMNSLLYLIAIVLILAWAIGFFAYNAGGGIHALLVLAIAALAFRLVRGNHSLL
jgi:hypothetical protein